MQNPVSAVLGGYPDRGVKILDNLLLLLYAFLMITGLDVGLFNLA